ncbi:MAG: hypothetical protein R2827_12365 [Bdellovibrionales bacterium]
MRKLVICLIFSTFSLSAFGGIIGDKDPRSIIGPNNDIEAEAGQATFQIRSTFENVDGKAGTSAAIVNRRIMITAKHNIIDTNTGERAKSATIVLNPEADFLDQKFIKVLIAKTVCREDQDKCWLVLEESLPESVSPLNVFFTNGETEDEIVKKFKAHFFPNAIGSKMIVNVSFKMTRSLVGRPWIELKLIRQLLRLDRVSVKSIRNFDPIRVVIIGELLMAIGLRVLLPVTVLLAMAQVVRLR